MKLQSAALSLLLVSTCSAFAPRQQISTGSQLKTNTRTHTPSPLRMSGDDEVAKLRAAAAKAREDAARLAKVCQHNDDRIFDSAA